MTEKHYSETRLQYACILYSHLLESGKGFHGEFLDAKERASTLISRVKTNDLGNLAIFKNSIAKLREAYELEE